LDKAIEVVLDVLAKHPPHRPRPTDRPHRTAPKLGPRAEVGQVHQNGVAAREPAGAPSREVSS
jgi:hypothetical protein